MRERERVYVIHTQEVVAEKFSAQYKQTIFIFLFFEELRNFQNCVGV